MTDRGDMVSWTRQDDRDQIYRSNNVNNEDNVNTLFLLLLKSKGLHDGFV